MARSIEPRNQALDLHCGDCRRAGDPNPPRLARFIRFGGAGEVQWASYAGMLKDFPSSQLPPSSRLPVAPLLWPSALHQRPDGGVTWRLRCPHGHNRPVRHERVVAAFEGFGSFPSRADDRWDVARVDV